MSSIISLAVAIILSLTTTLILYAHSSESNSDYVMLEVGKQYAIEIPSEIRLIDSITYEQELELFSQQLTRAFDISLSEARKYAPVIIKADINSDLSDINIASLIMTESTFRPDVKSSVGAYGSTQIRARYWNKFCQDKSHDLFEFEGNIMCGAEIVSHLKAQYCEGVLSCALEHYNVGRGNLRASAKYRQAGKRYTHKISNYSNQLTSTILASNTYDNRYENNYEAD